MLPLGVQEGAGQLPGPQMRSSGGGGSIMDGGADEHAGTSTHGSVRNLVADGCW